MGAESVMPPVLAKSARLRVPCDRSRFHHQVPKSGSRQTRSFADVRSMSGLHKSGHDMSYTPELAAPRRSRALKAPLHRLDAAGRATISPASIRGEGRGERIRLEDRFYCIAGGASRESLRTLQNN